MCERIKQRVLAPKVILYSAHAGPGLVLGATLAGADALLSKAAPARELLDVIRRVAAGERPLPPVDREHMDAAAGRIQPEDLPLVGLVAAGTSRKDIATTMGLTSGEVTERIRRLLGDVRPRITRDAV
jgi:two-component system response regulator DesR